MTYLLDASSLVVWHHAASPHHSRFHGRLFRPADEASGVNVAVLSHGLWQAAFGDGPAIVGRTVDLAGEAFEVIGILPDLQIDLPAPGIDSVAADVWR